jgi:hypothetical protein
MASTTIAILMYFLRNGGIRLKILKKTGLYQLKRRKIHVKTLKFLIAPSLNFHDELPIRNIFPIPLFNSFRNTPRFSAFQS